MELLPLGPVMMIDPPGIDDEGELGKLRRSLEPFPGIAALLETVDCKMAGLRPNENRAGP